MARLFLDGIAGVGKTTLCAQVRGQVPHVEEICASVRQHDFPGDGRTLEECVIILRWHTLREAERLRWTGLYDRSWLSHLTYAYAYERHAAIPGLLREYVEILADAVERGVLLFPNFFVRMSTDPASCSLERLIHRSSQPGRSWLPGFWYQPGFRADFEKGLALIQREVPPEARLHLISGPDAAAELIAAWKCAQALPALRIDLRRMDWDGSAG